MMTQDGGFFLKKRNMKKLNPQSKPLCAPLLRHWRVSLPPLPASPSTSRAVRGEPTPSGSSCPACSQMPSDQPACFQSRWGGQMQDGQVRCGGSGWELELGGSSRQGQDSGGLTFHIPNSKGRLRFLAGCQTRLGVSG